MARSRFGVRVSAVIYCHSHGPGEGAAFDGRREISTLSPRPFCNLMKTREQTVFLAHRRRTTHRRQLCLALLVSCLKAERLRVASSVFRKFVINQRTCAFARTREYRESREKRLLFLLADKFAMFETRENGRARVQLRIARREYLLLVKGRGKGGELLIPYAERISRCARILRNFRGSKWRCEPLRESGGSLAQRVTQKKRDCAYQHFITRAIGITPFHSATRTTLSRGRRLRFNRIARSITAHARMYVIPHWQSVVASCPPSILLIRKETVDAGFRTNFSRESRDPENRVGETIRDIAREHRRNEREKRPTTRRDLSFLLFFLLLLIRNAIGGRIGRHERRSARKTSA